MVVRDVKRQPRRNPHQLAVDKHEALLEPPKVAARWRRIDLPGLDHSLGGLGHGGLPHGELGETGGEGELGPDSIGNF